MQHFPRLALLVCVPVLAVLIASTGCGDKDTGKKPAAGGDAAPKAPADKPAAAGELEPLAGKGLGTLKGKVVYDGDPPTPADLKAEMEKQGDKAHCTKGPTLDPTWVVGNDKGVANVVVWLRAPRGKYLKVPEDQQKPAAAEVAIDQPFCMFTPHVVTLFPSYYDASAKAQKSTGQKFIAKNSAPINHNTAWKGDPNLNPGANPILQAGKDMTMEAKPCTPKRTGEDLIKLNCDIHKWMTAYAWAFDHPYSAVTKEDGTYEIKGVPAGVELEVVHWHESMQKPIAAKMTLKDGDNEFSAKVKK
jgi:hypothetical protein